MSTIKVEIRELRRYAQNYRGDIVFYDRFVLLCALKGVSPSKAAVDAGISKSLVTKWKVNSVDVPSPETLKKLSAYFDVPVYKLLSEEEQKTPTLIKKGERTVSDDDIKFALFGGDSDITDAMYDEVRNFAAYVKQREAERRK